MGRPRIALTVMLVLSVLVVAPTALTEEPNSKPVASSRPARPPKDKPTNPQLEENLKCALRDNLNGMVEEDMEQTLSVIHPGSPVFKPNKKLTEQVFKQFDLDYELVSAHLVGWDDDYAVLRAVQITRARGKQAFPFRDNESDAIHVFRKHGKKWKLWQSALLEVKYLDNEAED